MVSVRACDLCGKPSTKTCGNCKSAFYCSVDHQKLFWRYHKLVCGLNNENFTVVPTPDFQDSEALDLIPALAKLSNQMNDGRPSRWNEKKTKEEQDTIIKGLNQTLSSMDASACYLEQAKIRNNISIAITNADRKEDAWVARTLMPYYDFSRCLSQTMLSGSTYHYPYFKEYLFYMYLYSDFLDPSKFTTCQQTLSYLQQSRIRLEKIYNTLKENGMDKGGKYKYCTELIFRRVNVFRKVLEDPSKTLEEIEEFMQQLYEIP